jgi:hypothetical protein
VQVIEASQALFSLETLIITVSAGAVAALVVGFVTGYCCGRRCHKDDNTLVSIGLFFFCKQSKEFFRTCNVLPFSCTHLALWRGKEEGLKL